MHIPAEKNKGYFKKIVEQLKRGMRFKRAVDHKKCHPV
jgi:hypothetical protein